MKLLAGYLATWGTDIHLSGHTNKYILGVGYLFMRAAHWLYQR